MFPPILVLLILDGLFIFIFTRDLKLIPKRYCVFFKQLFCYFMLLRLISLWGLLILTLTSFEISHRYFWRCLGFVWLIGSVVSITKLILKNRKVNRALSFLKPLSLSYFSPELKKQISLSVKFYRLSSLESPCTIGIIEPKILLPTARLTSSQTQYVIAHELQHIQRHDCLKSLLIEIIGCLYWCFPPIYILQNQIRELREMKVDKDVVRHQSSDFYFGYIECLIEMAKSVDSTKNAQFNTSFVGSSRRILNQRVGLLLEGYDHPKVSIIFKIAVFVLVLILTSVYAA